MPANITEVLSMSDPKSAAELPALRLKPAVLPAGYEGARDASTAIYYLLTNVEHSFKDVLPGAVVAAVVLEASFQVLPIYVRYSNNVVALKALGGPALLLVWLYVMANVIVFGAEVNWRFAQKHRRPTADEQEAAGLA
jgi:uncharacterized BrkB/YihY/UPF0761 family membrane protein